MRIKLQNTYVYTVLIGHMSNFIYLVDIISIVHYDGDCGNKADMLVG